MYHTHEATERHDKVYALLGMSSDDTGRVKLFPNYQEPWEDILQRLAKFVVGDKLSVEVWPNKEAVIFRGKGCILGTISTVDSDIGWDKGQSLNVFWRNIFVQPENTRETSTRWTIQDSAKSIHKGDLICHLEGAARPTIIRLQQDFSAAIVIAAQPPRSIPNMGRFLEWSEVPWSTKACTREFTLVWDWDWDRSLERLSNLRQLKAWMHSTSWRPENERQELEGHLGEAGRYWNHGLLLGDAKNYQAAEESFEKAMTSYEMALQETDWDSIEIKRIYDAAKALLLFKGKGRLFKHLLQTGEADVNFRDRNSQTLISWAAERGYAEVVERLLQNGADVHAAAGDSGRTALQAAAGGGHLAIVERLLEEKADINAAAGEFSGRTALQAAAGGGHLAVVERLLEEKADVNVVAARYSGRTALQAAAEGGHLAVVERLLEEKADINAAAGGDSGRTALQAAAEGGHLAVVERLRLAVMQSQA
ncbi:ankyrin repeat-containing domain protein [Phaeosphaeriaceae sp. PMI808]|nr:ankyrin repeat-containing domain protein [Phaeosphaeriaceae sp. PMI808]